LSALWDCFSKIYRCYSVIGSNPIARTCARGSAGRANKTLNNPALKSQGESLGFLIL